jgi:peptidoglycan/LPS O-acetylase OafA/YrhL
MIGFSFIVLIAGLKYNLRYKWLERVGVFSYTLYISHFASIYLLKLILYKAGLNFYNINAMYAWYLGILMSVSVAAILYYFAEYPAIKYLEKRRQSKIITT